MKKSFYPLTPILFVLITGVFNSAIAQKVNNVQQGSIKAPAGLKIDGKLTEWGTGLQAYNKTTKVWYTLANDDQNIYLAIKSTDEANNNKILAGGISFSINTTGKKKDKGAYIITFPVVSGTGGRGAGRGRRGGFGQQDTPDSAAILAQHRQSLATCKTISAIGFKEITDTLISIYNEYSIKAAANFDDKGNFVYELAIPLKMLDITTGSQLEIAYNIKVNGIQAGGGPGMIKISGFGGGGGGRGGGGGGGGFGGGFGVTGSDENDMFSPTDFWGKYTLTTGN